MIAKDRNDRPSSLNTICSLAIAPASRRVTESIAANFINQPSG
jgi:hypothetical protein